jgi:hypothetical protein
LRGSFENLSPDAVLYKSASAVELETRIVAMKDALAVKNRAWFAEREMS